MRSESQNNLRNYFSVQLLAYNTTKTETVCLFYTMKEGEQMTSILRKQLQFLRPLIQEI